MKYARAVRIVVMTVFAVVALYVSGQELGEPPSRPIRVDRYVHTDSGTHVFLFGGHENREGSRALTARAERVRAVPEDTDADSRAFYVYPEPFTSMIALSVLQTPDGGVAFARNDAERLALMAGGAADSAREVYVYDMPVEGASEVFRLRSAAGDAIYTASRRERDDLLARGWTAEPSLGWAQSGASSGTGILLPSTLKLDENALSRVVASTVDGSALVFAASDAFALSLVEGQVLYAERSDVLPFGLVARVTEIRNVAAQIHVLTEPVEITDAFSEVHLFVDAKPFYFLPEQRRSGGFRLRPASEATSISWKAWATGADASVTANGAANWNTSSGSASGSVTVDASVQLGLTAEIVYNAYNMCTTKPTATFLLTPRETASIKFTASGTMAKAAEKRIAGPYSGTFALGGIPITGQVEVFAGFSASGTLNGSVSVTQTARATVGAQFDLTTRKFSKIACPSVCPSGFRCGPTTPAPTPTCSVSVGANTASNFEASATAYVKPQLYVFAGAWGTGLGPTAFAKAQVQARLEMPNVNLYAQLLAGASAKVTVFSCTVAELPQFETSPLEKKFATLPVALPAPSSLTASKNTYRDRVALTWKSVTYASGYNVYRAASLTGTKTRLTSKPTTALQFDDKTGVAQTTYYYWVTSMNGTKEGPLGSAVTGSRAK